MQTLKHHCRQQHWGESKTFYFNQANGKHLRGRCTRLQSISHLVLERLRHVTASAMRRVIGLVYRQSPGYLQVAGQICCHPHKPLLRPSAKAPGLTLSSVPLAAPAEALITPKGFGQTKRPLSSFRLRGSAFCDRVQPLRRGNR